jgi:hypothetical protein
MRASIVVPVGVALILGAYGAGRAGREAPSAPHRHRAHSCGEGKPAEVEVPPPVFKPEVREEDRAQAAVRLRDLQAELRKAVENRPAALNDLQNFLLSALAEGRLSASQVLEMFRTEQDGATLDVLQGTVAAVPEAADAPGVRDAFERIARSDGVPERRQAAIAFLGGASDGDGRIRRTLLSLAESDGDLSVRLTALGALGGYSQRNEGQAAAVNAGLLEIARPATAGDDVRTQALSSVEVRRADGETLRRLSELLSDPSSAVRLASAERLGDVPPSLRDATVSALEGALSREPNGAIKSHLLASLVKAGRGESLPALERAVRDPQLREDALDYLQILRAGHVDWSEIAHEKSKRDAAR